ncbi:hypothetical protein CRE_25637 [Caenorhabditis remanei]|uniref:Uncharacterized protein n=1 Tax=Caenorhabditis remanei TaxID=31234 RepID=E3ML57_CAERE|nr:hypothetical protein CRE_25637 [Caenorhabditis remanei]
MSASSIGASSVANSLFLSTILSAISIRFTFSFLISHLGHPSLQLNLHLSRLYSLLDYSSLSPVFPIPELHLHFRLSQVWEGHNFADFVDPEIQQKLLKEEELLEEAGEYESDLDSDDEKTKEKMSQALQIRKKEKLLTLEHTVNKRIARLEHELGE